MSLVKISFAYSEPKLIRCRDVAFPFLESLFQDSGMSTPIIHLSHSFLRITPKKTVGKIDKNNKKPREARLLYA